MDLVLNKQIKQTAPFLFTFLGYPFIVILNLNSSISEIDLNPLSATTMKKRLSRFSLDSDFTIGKNVPCRFLRLKFQSKFIVLKDDFLFKLSAITMLCSSPVALRELGRERKWRRLLTSLFLQCVNQGD